MVMTHAVKQVACLEVLISLVPAVAAQVFPLSHLLCLVVYCISLHFVIYLGGGAGQLASLLQKKGNDLKCHEMFSHLVFPLHYFIFFTGKLFIVFYLWRIYCNHHFSHLCDRSKNRWYVHF